jgi:branched-chain amino acid transport system substrate-binding protein
MLSVLSASELATRRVRRACGLVAALGLSLGLSLALAAGGADPAAAEVLIGVAAPAQGPSLGTGRVIARGAAAAAAHIDANGGVLGERIAIAEADDECTAAGAETAARDLVARGVTLVVGHPCTAAAIAAAKIYAAAGVVFIAPAARHPAFTSPRAGPTVFRLAGRDDAQGRIAGDYLARTFPGQPLALVADGSRMADDLVRGARAALKDAGRDDVLTAQIEGGEKDYTKLIARLQTAGTAAVFFAGFPIEGGLFLKQMRAANLNAVFLGSDALANGQLAETAGTDTLGARALLPHDPASDVSQTTQRDRFGLQRPAAPLAAAYAAVEAWAAAATKAQSLDAAAVAAGLQEGTFDTVLGPIAFDGNGDARVPSYDIVEWKDGAWRRLP